MISNLYHVLTKSYLTKVKVQLIIFAGFKNKGHKWVKATLSRTQQKGTTEDCILWVIQVISETAHDSFDGLDFFQLFPADLKSNIAPKIEDYSMAPRATLHY